MMNEHDLYVTSMNWPHSGNMLSKNFFGHVAGHFVVSM